MKLQWIGHACFHVEAGDGTVIIIDPYDESVPYKAPEGPAAIVLSTHDHFDHNAVDRVKGDPQVIRGVGEWEVKGINIRGIPAYHDEKGGKDRGRTTIFRLTVDGVTLVHFGDLGHVITAEQERPLQDAEVAMIPVGGYYTIGPREALETIRLLPRLRVIVPMHYKTELVKDWPIVSVEEFLELVEFPVKRVGSSEVEITREKLPEKKEVWVLEHA
jgi:L-ascorbate metabolism protein UlaG (beta-lactamase superfamily)